MPVLQAFQPQYITVVLLTKFSAVTQITQGTLGTFKAPTAEGRAIEILTYLQNLEKDTAKNPNAVNAVTGSFVLEDGMFSGTFSLPAEQSISTGGSLTIRATPYLVGEGLAPGGDSPTFKSTYPEGYALEVLMYLQFTERIASRNPRNLNYISGTFNSDTGLYQGTFQIPIKAALSESGAVVIQADEYLLT